MLSSVWTCFFWSWQMLNDLCVERFLRIEEKREEIMDPGWSTFYVQRFEKEASLSLVTISFSHLKNAWSGFSLTFLQILHLKNHFWQCVGEAFGAQIRTRHPLRHHSTQHLTQKSNDLENITWESTMYVLFCNWTDKYPPQRQRLGTSLQQHGQPTGFWRSYKTWISVNDPDEKHW